MKLLVLPGDGVGPEVTAEALRLLRWFAEHRGLDLTLAERDFGIVNWHKHGTMMPDETWAQIEAADAILFGATGSMDQQGMVPPEGLAATDAQDAEPVCQHATRAHATGTLQGQPLQGADHGWHGFDVRARTHGQDVFCHAAWD